MGNSIVFFIVNGFNFDFRSREENLEECLTGIRQELKFLLELEGNTEPFTNLFLFVILLSLSSNNIDMLSS